jgi:hypothetical protein
MMRELHRHIDDLMESYRRLKLKVEFSQRTILPPDEPKPSNPPDPYKSQSIRETELLFVAKVEKYVMHYYRNHQYNAHKPTPYDCLEFLFTHRFCPEASRFKSYEQMAIYFRSRIKRERDLGDFMIGTTPKSLQHREHLCKISSRIEEYARDYYIMVGLIKR